ncbi:aldose 1-epimerase family protein [Gynurincola endophyticus]|jgi:galactose mutarotase-like enzyme|uniref:aldose 1-epimerase family protein n=1 Tax=Gynurincola endophyticus TaxID=2479004 RepID=UPI000F8E1F27|nr:aldose 1-epimerase family protein [Gynurincola endophyticus]
MYTIQSDQIIAGFEAKGAELTSLKQLHLPLEYIWQGDPAFWGKHSPVLFPIVGGLKANVYRYEGNTYSLGRHGFARDREFIVEKQQKDSITFLLRSDEISRKVYPFEFEFRIRYAVFEATLMITYDIVNTSNFQAMYVSVGAHPAFNVPLEKGLNYQDYFLEFEEEEDAPRYLLTEDGLIKENPVPFLQGNKLPLDKSLFRQDALVFKNLQSSTIRLATEKSKHGLDFSFDEFPFFGIWAAKNADFVCLEPWCGIADHENHDQNLINKEGINTLPPNEAFTRNWSVTVF